MAEEKLEAGIKFRDIKNMPGKTITEKLQKAGIKNIPKTLTLEKAIELFNKLRANYLNANIRFNIPICCKLRWWFNIEQRCVLYATR